MEVAQHPQGSSRPGLALVRRGEAEGQAQRCHVVALDELGLYALSEGHGRGPAAEAVAAATLRACTRARCESSGTAGDAECRALISAVAAEVHLLCSSQQGYTSMAASLAVVLLSHERASVGIVGDCVAFVERGGVLSPAACGQSLLLGPMPKVSPSVASFRREAGGRLWLAMGAVIELLMSAPEHAHGLSPRALLDASWARAPHRDAALVTVDLDDA